VPNLEYEVEHLFSIVCAMAKPPEAIGPTPEGLRVNFYFLGGEIEGPRLRGKMRPVGGDSFVVRTDGVALIDMRTTFESHDGALIVAQHNGLCDLGSDGYERALARQLSSRATARVAARYMTAHPSYLWLNRLQCFGILEIDRETFTLRYDIHALR
jgi:hypothetical protein